MSYQGYQGTMDERTGAYYTFVGGKAVLGEGCRNVLRVSRRTLLFWAAFYRPAGMALAFDIRSLQVISSIVNQSSGKIT